MFNCVLPINSHTRRFAVTVLSRRKLLTLRQLYPRAPSRPSVSPCRMGWTSASTSLTPQLVQAVIPPQHDAFAGVQSSSGALKHLALKYKSEMFNCVLPINSHTQRFGLSVSSRRCPSSFYESYRMGGTSTSTSLRSQLVQAVIPPQHGASVEKDPPVVLFSIHSPTLDKVWYHAPWLLGYMRRR